MLPDTHTVIVGYIPRVSFLCLCFLFILLELITHNIG